MFVGCFCVLGIWFEFSRVCMWVVVLSPSSVFAMAFEGGPSPSIGMCVVVDPADFGGQSVPPFIPNVVPGYFCLRRTPEEALSRWSWGRENAADRLADCLLVTYKFTAHGLGCAMLGQASLEIGHWGRDGLPDSIRLHFTTLESVFWCEDKETLMLDSVEELLERLPDADQYLQIR